MVEIVPNKEKSAKEKEANHNEKLADEKAQAQENFRSDWLEDVKKRGPIEDFIPSRRPLPERQPSQAPAPVRSKYPEIYPLPPILADASVSAMKWAGHQLDEPIPLRFQSSARAVDHALATINHDLLSKLDTIRSRNNFLVGSPETWLRDHSSKLAAADRCLIETWKDVHTARNILQREADTGRVLLGDRLPNLRQFSSLLDIHGAVNKHTFETAIRDHEIASHTRTLQNRVVREDLRGLVATVLVAEGSKLGFDAVAGDYLPRLSERTMVIDSMSPFVCIPLRKFSFNASLTAVAGMTSVHALARLLDSYTADK